MDSPEPPVHLVLGSEAIGMLKHADEARTAEMEKWMEVSISTDHDEANNFLTSDLGKTFLKK
ncbi:short chain dehydrogenase [compost metagenome]